MRIKGSLNLQRNPSIQMKWAGIVFEVTMVDAKVGRPLNQGLFGALLEWPLGRRRHRRRRGREGHYFSTRVVEPKACTKLDLGAFRFNLGIGQTMQKQTLAVC